MARQGWEYVRAEHLPAEAPGGWFRGAAAGGADGAGLPPRPRGARPAARGARHEATADAATDAVAPVSPERAAGARRDGPERHERVVRRRAAAIRAPRRAGAPERGDGRRSPTPLRPSPRLGPADGP